MTNVATTVGNGVLDGGDGTEIALQAVGSFKLYGYIDELSSCKMCMKIFSDKFSVITVEGSE